MTLTRRRFDYAEFVEGYREACGEWGIDPVEGATSYQVVRVRAEQQRLAESRSERRWWERHELWLDCPPYHSEAEGEAIWSLFAQAYGVTVRLLIRAARLRRMALAAVSLREMHQGRGKRGEAGSKS